MIEHKSQYAPVDRSSLKDSLRSRSPSNEAASLSYKEYQEKLKHENRHYEIKLKSLKEKILAL
jgi:hypothetical protein